MTGPKYNYFNVRDELRIAGGTYSGQISFGDSAMNISSSTDGTLNISADTALTATATTINLAGDLQLGANNITTTGDLSAVEGVFTGAVSGVAGKFTGDLTRRTAKYISGNVGRPDGYTNISGSGTPGVGTILPSEGVIYLSGKSGAIRPRLPTPTEGQTLTLIYTHTGATAQVTASISSAAFQVGGSQTTYYYLVLTNTGDAATLAGLSTTWYPTHPSGMAGNTWSTARS